MSVERNAERRGDSLERNDVRSRMRNLAWLATALMMTLVVGEGVGDQAHGSPAKEPPPSSAELKSDGSLPQKPSRKEKEGDGKGAPAALTEKRPAPGESEASSPPEPVEEPAKKAVGSVILTAKLALMADLRLFPYDIEVEIDGGRAVLSGKVSSSDEQLAALEIVKSVPSVKEVVNKLVADPDLKSALAKHRDELIV